MLKLSAPLAFKILKFLVPVILVIMLVAAGVTMFSADREEESDFFDESRDSQIIESLELSREVVLLKASTQGIHEVENYSAIFGDRKIPGTGKSELIEYSYQNKLGFDGHEVSIKSKRNNRFEITIPEFKFIGYDNVVMDTVHSRNGFLSFSTEDINTGEVITEIMEGNRVEELIDANREMLEREAEDLYWDLALEIDDEVDLRFKFK